MSQKEQTNIIDACLNGKLSADQREALQRAMKAAATKDNAWKNIENKTNARRFTIGKTIRITLRYAAVLLPFLVIGIVWASDIKGFFIKQYEAITNHSAAQQTPQADMQADTISIQFEAADMQTIISDILAKYPQIKGVRGHITDDDSVLITTSFVNQSLDDIFEELNIHFDKKFALSDDGYLTISD